MKDKNILVLGVGNILLTDEGFGVRAVEYLQTHYDWPPNVRLMDGGTSGLMLMGELQQCDVVIVLDVVLGSGEPGSVYLLEGEDLRNSLSFRDSMHQTDLLDTLISCELAGHRPQAFVIGFQPYDFKTMSVELTPEAQAALPDFCAKVVSVMAEWGIVAKARTPSSLP